MANQIVRKLDFGRKLALSIVGATVLTLPIVLGLARVVQGNAAAGYMSSESEVGAIGAPSSKAQSQTSPKLSFDTVSIKVAADCMNKEGGWSWPLYRAGGSYGNCGGLEWLIKEVYNLRTYNLLKGAPAWSKKISYRIEAKAEGNPNKEQMQRMVQSMLEDRFKLKMHSETHESTVYSLVVEKGGHKLQLAKDQYGNPMTSEPSLEEINTQLAKPQPPRKFKSGED
jgi:hypothetical protein